MRTCQSPAEQRQALVKFFACAEKPSDANLERSHRKLIHRLPARKTDRLLIYNAGAQRVQVALIVPVCSAFAVPEHRGSLPSETMSQPSSLSDLALIYYELSEIGPYCSSFSSDSGLSSSNDEQSVLDSEQFSIRSSKSYRLLAMKKYRTRLIWAERVMEFAAR